MISAVRSHSPFSLSLSVHWTFNFNYHIRDEWTCCAWTYLYDERDRTHPSSNQLTDRHDNNLMSLMPEIFWSNTNYWAAKSMHWFVAQRQNIETLQIRNLMAAIDAIAKSTNIQSNTHTTHVYSTARHVFYECDEFPFPIICSILSRCI